jgi:hypothetical protein
MATSADVMVNEASGRIGGAQAGQWLGDRRAGGHTAGVGDEVFVGRHDEQQQFAALLGGLAATRTVRASRWRRDRRSGEESGDASKSRVVLVYGLGGSGKSRLLRQFQSMATGQVPGSPVKAGQARTVWLDWEDKQRDDPGSYAGPAGPSLVTLQEAVIAAAGTSGRSRLSVITGGALSGCPSTWHVSRTWSHRASRRVSVHRYRHCGPRKGGSFIAAQYRLLRDVEFILRGVRRLQYRMATLGW